MSGLFNCPVSTALGFSVPGTLFHSILSSDPVLEKGSPGTGTKAMILGSGHKGDFYREFIQTAFTKCPCWSAGKPK